MLQNVRRLSRSYFEDREYTPDWRNRQATSYFLCFETLVALQSVNARYNNVASALLNEVVFPEWEDDLIVKARFWHLVGAPSPNTRWTQAFDWGESCIRTDPIMQSAVSIRGWLIAGLSDEEIIERDPTSAFNIKVFHDTWFDVRRFLPWPHILTRALCGPAHTASTPEWERFERTIFRAALGMGPQAVDRLLIPMDKTSPEELQWLVETRTQMQARLAWDRTARNSGTGIPQQRDINIHQEDQRTSINRELARSKANLENKSDDKYRQFFDDLSTVWEQHGVSTDPDEFFADKDEVMDDLEKKTIRMPRRVG